MDELIRQSVLKGPVGLGGGMHSCAIPVYITEETFDLSEVLIC